MEKHYLKSPMNYIGGKYKLLPKLFEIFPNDIINFYDVFGGGANVSINVCADKVIYNDIVPQVYNLLDNLKALESSVALNKVKMVVQSYSLTKTNENGFKQLREYYNTQSTSWEYFYVLMCYSFNYQFRFNSNLEYNSSFGKNRSEFNKSLENRLVLFADKLKKMNIEFMNKDFRDLNYSQMTSSDFVYFDSPYLISCGNYNDGKRGFKGWTENDDIDLFNLCDYLNSKGVRFALSNVLEHKGLKNEYLIKWSEKYKVHFLDKDYENCNYQLKRDNNKTVEVVITNY